MKCPRDGVELQKIRIEGLKLELDKCHKCDGIWCDKGEMEQLRDSHLADAEEFIELKYGDPEYTEGDVAGYMRCPRCDDGRLHQHKYTYTNAVEIDRCDKCMGIWLDDNELNSIITERVALDVTENRGKLGAFIKALGNLLGQ
jgi:Zn-finger nucleic acid-binding protein